MENIKLLIAVPCMDTVPVQFLRSLTALTRRLTLDGVSWTLAIESQTLVYIALERLAGRGGNHKFSHILWLDSDMEFPDDLFETLRSTGKDFVTGIACGRRPPFCPCVFKALDPPALFQWEEMPEEPFQIAGCGFAGVLIRTDIVRRVMQRFGNSFNPIPALGEDLSFCKRAAETGAEIWAAPAAQLGHVGRISLRPEDAQLWNQIKKQGGERSWQAAPTSASRSGSTARRTLKSRAAIAIRP